MNLTKQQKFKKTRVEKGTFYLLRIIDASVKFGAGFYVGFMEGQGALISPATKYTLLSAPCVLNASVVIGGQYLIGRLTRKGFEERPSLLGKVAEEHGLNDKQTEYLDNILRKFADNSLNTPILAKSVGKTALKTTVGYITGYGLAKLF